MAFILCPRHGGNAAAAVCSHIAARVIAEIPVLTALVPVYASYAGTTLGPTWLCPACAAGMAVPASGATFTGDDGLDRYLIEVDWRPVCSPCFEESRLPTG